MTATFACRTPTGFFVKTSSKSTNLSASQPLDHASHLPVPQPPSENEDILSADEFASIGDEGEEDPTVSDRFLQLECSPLYVNKNRLNESGT